MRRVVDGEESRNSSVGFSRVASFISLSSLSFSRALSLSRHLVLSRAHPRSRPSEIAEVQPFWLAAAGGALLRALTFCALRPQTNAGGGDSRDVGGGRGGERTGLLDPQPSTLNP